MKPVVFILGLVILVAGIGLTGWTWYDAAQNGRYSDGSAYAGPVLIVLGLLRMVRAAATIPLPGMVIMAGVGFAILIGYADSAAIKAAFPQATLETSNSSRSSGSQAVSTPNQ
jgi:hypothetical protein